VNFFFQTITKSVVDNIRKSEMDYGNDLLVQLEAIEMNIRTLLSSTEMQLPREQSERIISRQNELNTKIQDLKVIMGLGNDFRQDLVTFIQGWRESINALNEEQEPQQSTSELDILQQILGVLNHTEEAIIKLEKPLQALAELIQCYSDLDQYLSSVDQFVNHSIIELSFAEIANIEVLKGRRAIIFDAMTQLIKNKNMDLLSEEMKTLFVDNEVLYQNVSKQVVTLVETHPVVQRIKANYENRMQVLEQEQERLSFEKDGVQRQLLAVQAEKENLIGENRALKESFDHEKTEHDALKDKHETYIQQSANGEQAVLLELETVRKKLKTIQSQLRSTIEITAAENAQQAATIARLQEQLVLTHAPNEKICSELVGEKLLPLTQKYHRHLTQALYQLQNSKRGNMPGKQQAIQEKINFVESLLADLNKVKQDANPDVPDNNQQCLAAFYTKLQDRNKIVKHRDAAWPRYFANVLKAIGIVLTGVLPGLVMLGLASKHHGKSVKYWQSHGETFFNATQKEKPSDLPSAEKKPQQR
jgi:hypothetical protein